MLTTLHERLRAFWDLSAWMMIILGLGLFALRVEFAPGGWINLPVAFTVLQTAGLMFCLFGMQSMASMAVWPSVKLGELLDQAMLGNKAAGYVAAALLVFNGLSIIAFALWITSAMGAGIRAG